MGLDVGVRHAPLFREGDMKSELAVHTSGDWRYRYWKSYY